MKPTDLLDRHFPRLTSEQKRALRKLGIKTVRDLLYHFPARYEDARPTAQAGGIAPGAEVALYGTIRKPETRKTWKSRRPVAEAWLEDASGRIKLMWFSQPYIAKTLSDGMMVKASGRVSGTAEKPYLANPRVEKSAAPEGAAPGSLFVSEPTTNRQPPAPLFPVYPESKGISSLWLFHAVKRVLAAGAGAALPDPLPPEILARYKLPTLATALVWVHRPERRADAEAAKKRFAFEEVFALQTALARERARTKAERALPVAVDRKALASFVDSFPFPATAAQTRAIDAIVRDFEQAHPMLRLLEGDVGSGKTAVAAATAYLVATSHPPKVRTSDAKVRTSDVLTLEKVNYDEVRGGNLQVAYLCPTEILAKQHFSTFVSYFRDHPISIGLITGSECRVFPSRVRYEESAKLSKATFRKRVADGLVPIVIGTHALVEKSLVFKHLAYAIIDEQHRFGVAHRFALSRGKTQNERGSDADDESDLLYRDITYRIRGAIFAVKKELGLGHKESVYASALAEEFSKIGLAFSREVRIPIRYREKQVGTYIPDFVVEGAVVVELKSLYFTGAKEKKQLWTYLKGSKYRLGLLVNFTNADVEISRIVFDTAREPSASRPRLSAYRPHLLSMTATPIPRTLALTIYGDLDLTLLDQMPLGRKPIATEVLGKKERERAYERVQKELAAGRQAYVICPRIDEPDPQKAFALQAKSVNAEAARLRKDVFPEASIGILHSKLSPAEKEAVMKEFAAGKLDILVATSVVEVGVNVQNATVIVIEGAERFGLAQLHQLRGRVLRSTHQAYCFALPESFGQSTKERMKALTNAANGFALAEYDLALRGAGELAGGKQWGVSDIAMEALRNRKLVEAARAEAAALVARDPELAAHPTLRARSAAALASLHLE